MEQKYNFKIVFEKLEEAKKDFLSNIEVDYTAIDEIDDNIRILKEYIAESENVITYTRT